MRPSGVTGTLQWRFYVGAGGCNCAPLFDFAPPFSHDAPKMPIEEAYFVVSIEALENKTFKCLILILDG